MAEPIRVGLWHVVRELRGGFVFRPGAITLAMAAMAVGLTSLEERIIAVPAWNDLLDRLFPPEPQAAYVVLGTIAGSMITVVSVVYSILLVVLTFASTQFSPRVLVGYVEDRVSQTTLGVFIGTFTYCLLTLPAVRSQPRPFVPSIAVIVAIILAIACLVCLLFFIHHIAASIQASHVVDRIARETERDVDEVFPGPLAEYAEEEVPALEPGGTPVLATRSGYIRSIDESSLLMAARGSDTAMRVERFVGQFVIEGTPLLVISPTGRVNDALHDACVKCFNIGPARTMWQDVEFGILQVVDIALKALSPAVNDPTTALTCIDQLGRILMRAALRQPPRATLRDLDGTPRVILRRTSFPRLLEVAFSQIGHYGKADVAVPLRLLRVLGELASATRHAPYAVAVLGQARRLADACAGGFPEADRDELDQRLAAVEHIVAARLGGLPS
ncbi:MAG: DUF2254 domain-containing protein [Isosphaeraceae bacterium]